MSEPSAGCRLVKWDEMEKDVEIQQEERLRERTYFLLVVLNPLEKFWSFGSDHPIVSFALKKGCIWNQPVLFW